MHDVACEFACAVSMRSSNLFGLTKNGKKSCLRQMTDLVMAGALKTFVITSVNHMEFPYLFSRSRQLLDPGPNCLYSAGLQSLYI